MMLSSQVYSFSRDGALPFSSFFYNMSKNCGSPTRAIWLCVLVSFLLGVPGLANNAALSALFSLTATGLYSSYLIPILLRVTVSRDTFEPAEFNLGNWSIPMGWLSVCWCLFMTVILCLPQQTPISLDNMNYSPIALGGLLICCWAYWIFSARFWFRLEAKVSVDSTMPSCDDFEPILLQTPTKNNFKNTNNSESMTNFQFNDDGNNATAILSTV
mmetsp:Transcript_32688/g.44822  ORF Transcript_32688/g.44822 Transcript_32688/m.44822 type:complete len:215 (-) Transcript_32688:138-782(-)